MVRPLLTLLPLLSILIRASAEPRPASPEQAGGRMSLSTAPRRVYKARDTGNLPLETWFIEIQVEGQPVTGARPSLLKSTLYSGATRLEFREIAGIALLAMSERPLGGRRFALPLLDSRPSGWKADRIEIELTLEAGGTTERLACSVALEEYVQKTSLVFPFVGAGLVTQGPVHDRGHYGPSNHFAIDAIGLTAEYAPQVRDDDTNEAYAGWQREVIAPADGIVVRARGDVPSNPRPGEMLDPSIVARLPDPEPRFTVPGNHVVIDHGNSEFSVLMHLDAGSVEVKAGDRVKQGEVIGLLGNSGDSGAPHLHYQLQSGPDVFVADPLPVTFSNLPGRRLVRGTYFHAE